jgi:hypothetical protein
VSSSRYHLFFLKVGPLAHLGDDLSGVYSSSPWNVFM